LLVAVIYKFLKLNIMYNFSFIDFGQKDFIRDKNGEVLTKQFGSYAEAENFIMDGGLDDFGWTNEGTRKWCWEAEDGEDVP
jgi:hypothetical protein